MGGNLTNVHPSAANDFLLKESQWFSVDHSHVGHFMSDVFQNYKDWSNRAKRQGFFSRNAFSYSKMKEQLVSILDSYVPQISIETNFKMPKIKKIELPKKEKVNG